MPLYTFPQPKRSEFSQSDSVRYTPDWSVNGTVSETIRQEYRNTFHAFGNGKNGFNLHLDAALASEEYRIRIHPEGVDICAGSEMGLRYARYTLHGTDSLESWKCGTISDKPMLQMRGYHLNLNTFRHTDLAGLLQLVQWVAKAKLNTLLIEYGRRFPYRTYKDIRAYDALTEDEVRILVSTARGYGLEVIPLVQSFGHLEYALSSSSLADIREIEDKPASLCPLNPDSFAFVTNQLTEILALHPGLRYLHIGCDETRQLGKCPQCAKYIEEHGKGALYAQFVNRVVDWLCERGVTPLIYDDMLCAHPDALDKLDRRAVIVYWDYWSTAPKMPCFIARYGNAPVYCFDRRWADGTWKAEPPASRILDTFCRGGCPDVFSALGDDFMKRYGAYLGPDAPKYFKPFLYFEYYHDQGFRTIGMPTALGDEIDFLGMPDQARYTANIHICCERAKESGSMGVITSTWFPYPESLFTLALLETGTYAWGLPDNAPSTPDWRK